MRVARWGLGLVGEWCRRGIAAIGHLPSQGWSARRLYTWDVARAAGGPPTRARVARLAFGAGGLRRPADGPHGDPLAELVLTVLSQSTNDRNRDVAFLRLREPLPLGRRRARPGSVIEEAIRPGGISKVKSTRIMAILRCVVANAREARRRSRWSGSPTSRYRRRATI